MAAGAPLIEWTQRRRRVFFALTPLIDVMFLLLIFFMLSSQLALYGLVPVSGVGQATAGTAGAEAAVAPMVVRVGHGFARIAGRDVPLGEVVSVVEPLVDDGVTGFIVLPNTAANVQDVITALEGLKTARARDVTLVTDRRGG